MRNILLLILTFPLFIFAQSPVERAKKFYEERKPADARKILSGIDDNNKEYAEAQYYLGRISFDEKKYDDAQDFFEEAVDTNDKVADYYNWLGNTYGTIAQDANMIKQGMLAPKMKTAWEKAIALNPSLIDARTSLIQYYLQAPGFMGGSIEKAKETAKGIIPLNAAQGHLQLGNIYVKEKKIPEAEKEFLEMVKADPAFISGLANFYLNQKQYDKAFAVCEDAIKKNPESMAYVYQLGRASAISGQRLERGEECLKRYLAYTPKSNEPSHAGATMRLAQLTEKKGNKMEAKKLFQEALKLDPSLKEAQEGLKRTS
ncbi:hypothetical protein BH09BAC3_BH09BAC3_00620 [soil metagenome]